MINHTMWLVCAWISFCSV